MEERVASDSPPSAVPDRAAVAILHNTQAIDAFPIWLLGLLLVAFALRIFRLDGQSIWWDEGISLHLGTSSLADIVADRLNNIHPPLYFFILKGWLSLVGVNPFSARYLSVLASWLQVAVIYAVARRWFSRRTAAVAGSVAAFSAVSVIYGQEIRVYAMLALIYLALLALTYELTRPPAVIKKMEAVSWLALGLVMWTGLHLHYITVIVVAYVSAWAIILFLRQRRWRDLSRWMVLLFLVGLTSIPWFLALWRNWLVVQGEANAGTFVADPVPFDFLLSQVWVFHLTGLAGALARPVVRWLAAVTAVSLLLLILARLFQKGTRRDTVVLLAHWLVPLSSALIVWLVRSFSHPRYVAMFVPGLILLVAYLALPPKDRLGQRWTWVANLLSVLLVLSMILSSLWGLWLYFVDPGVAKDNMRGVARYLEKTAEPGDLILVPDTDWSFPFEYKGGVTVAMPGFDDPDGGWSNLSALTSDTRRIFLVDYGRGTRDWQGAVPFALEKAGSIVKETEFDSLVVRSYELDETVVAPEMSPKKIKFGPLELSGAWTEQGAPAGGPIVLALRWHLPVPFEENAHIALRLLDDGGWPFAKDDTLLINKSGRPTSQWSVDESVVTYHILPVPPAIPPLAYDLGVQVYVPDETGLRPLELLDEQNAPQGQEYVISQVRLAYAPGSGKIEQGQLPIAPWSQSIELAPGLSLLAAELPAGSVMPGQPLIVELLWHATAAPLPDLQPELALVQGGNDLVVNDDDPAYGHYPIDLWSRGEQVYERRRLSIPPDASGVGDVVLRLDNSELVLGEMEIKVGEHVFTQPPVAYTVDIQIGEMARLTGFDLPRETYSSDETVPLTLFWQSMRTGSERDYIVFAHLLAEDGHLIGQHDSRPANGRRPTSGWLEGEFVVDLHEMTFRDTGYQGEARIETGLYDPVNGERLLLPDGSDRLILPIILDIK